MNEKEKYIRFDWAAKRILRDKANFGVLEGFLTVLIGEKITIKEIIESEGNQEDAEDKFNRVDIMAINSKGELIIVEIQNSREAYYLERILYGVAKAITDHMEVGDSYSVVKKVHIFYATNLRPNKIRYTYLSKPLQRICVPFLFRLYEKQQISVPLVPFALPPPMVVARSSLRAITFASKLRCAPFGAHIHRPYCVDVARRL
jgi:hypothetical protein